MRIHAAAKVSAFYDDDPQFEPTKLGQKRPLGFPGGLGRLGLSTRPIKAPCKSQNSLVHPKSPKTPGDFSCSKTVNRGVASQKLPRYSGVTTWNAQLFTCFP